MKKKTPKLTLGQQYQQLLDKRERAERKHIRTFNAWVAANQDVRRMEKRLDKEQAEKHSEIAGKVDIREIAPPPVPIPPVALVAAAVSAKKPKKRGTQA